MGELIAMELEGFDGVWLIDRRGSDIELRVHNTLNTDCTVEKSLIWGRDGQLPGTDWSNQS